MKHKIFILSGPIRSGKTTRLKEWVINKNAGGILSPVVEGKRMFYDIQKGEYFPMEASMDEKDVLKVGRFIFSLKSFHRAEKIIVDAIEHSEWVVIDEIGPLELKGAGFCDVLKKILNDHQKDFNLLLVVRDSILQEFLLFFRVKEFVLFVFPSS